MSATMIEKLKSFVTAPSEIDSLVKRLMDLQAECDELERERAAAETSFSTLAGQLTVSDEQLAAAIERKNKLQSTLELKRIRLNTTREQCLAVFRAQSTSDRSRADARIAEAEKVRDSAFEKDCIAAVFAAASAIERAGIKIAPCEAQSDVASFLNAVCDKLQNVCAIIARDHSEKILKKYKTTNWREIRTPYWVPMMDATTIMQKSNTESPENLLKERINQLTNAR